ncbi:hypothetical protein HZB01_02385 [Candidatus Woesearchaeota archaeon]|nr:hypothetical protein [Candidatus Woesearchaeota archaeon]
MFRKKGQAALEFLMTYGWAILVVLVVIGALAYFGVLSPQSILPEKCVMGTGLSCTDHQVSATSFTLLLENGMGSPINITGLSLTQVGGTSSTCSAVLVPVDGPVVANGASIAIANGTTPCTFTDTGSKAKFNIAVDYYNVQTGAAYPHTITGELFAEMR